MTLLYVLAGDKDNNDNLLHSGFEFTLPPKLPSSFKSKHVLGTQMNCLSETALLSIQSMFIFAEESINGKFNLLLDL